MGGAQRNPTFDVGFGLRSTQPTIHLQFSGIFSFGAKVLSKKPGVTGRFSRGAISGKDVENRSTLKKIPISMESMLTQIKDLAAKLGPTLIEIRRHIHAHPELSGQENQTAAYVSGVLSSCGLHVREGIGKTGVLGELKANTKKNKWLAIRTDMDALPITEATCLDFASRNLGIMHACGHDIHMTVGLGTAMVLSKLGEAFS